MDTELSPDQPLPVDGTGWWSTPGGIRAKYNESSRYMRAEQYSYNINRAFVSGQQWLWYDSNRNSVSQLPRDPARTRATFNRLAPASRHIVAKIMSKELAFEVPPSDSDDATVRGALTSTSVVRDLHKEHGWELFKEQTLWDTWLGGTAGLCVEWDPAKGTSLGYTDSGREYGTGDLCEYQLSILEMCWEPGVRDAEKGYWWMRAQALPPEEVKRMYGLDYLPQADAQGSGTPFTQQLLRQDRGNQNVDLCLVLTLYMRPHKGNSRGTVATIVGNRYVGKPTGWMFPWRDRLNLVVFRETKVPGRATGDTILSAAVPLQTQYNAAWSNILEHMKLAGSARMLIPEAALDGVDELTDLPGEIVMYNAASGGKPEWMTPAQMPAWIIEGPMQIAAQMDDILGLHDVSRGEAPKNIQSGVGISVLVEQDATPVGQLTREVAGGFERFAHLCLKLYEAKVQETRTARIKVPGQKSPETVQWSGADLKGQCNVIVPIDQVMPRSRTAMLAFARELWDRKIIATPEQFAAIAELPDQDHLLEQVNPDAAKAASENHEMSTGGVPVPAAFDNHAVHIERHNTFRKTRAYRTLPPETQQIVDLHVQGHETRQAEELGRKVAMQNAHPVLGAMPTADGTQLPPMGPAAPGAPGGGDTGGALYAQPMQPIQPYGDRGETGAMGPNGGGGI